MRASPPEDIFRQKMSLILRVNHFFIGFGQCGLAEQAGTPMAVTGNGTSFAKGERGASIFCQKISSGDRGQTAPGLGHGAGGRV